MCKKLIFLISFVLVLSFGSNALAEDLSIPYWAGGERAAFALWYFNTDELSNWNGASGLGWPDLYEGPDPNFVDTHVAMVQQNYTWHDQYEGRQGVWVTEGDGPGEPGDLLGMMVNYEPDPECTKKIFQFQVTYFPIVGLGTVEPQAGVDGCGSLYTPDEWDYGDNVVALGGGWFHTTMEVTFEDCVDDSEWWELMGANHAIDEVIIDTVCYSGASPPAGPGRAGTPDPNLASNPKPEDGEYFVDPAAVLTWDDPCEALHPDPNFDVFLGVHSDTNDDPNVVRDVNTLNPAPDMNWGTQYFLRVDTIGADGTVYKNIDWSFTIGGKAYDPIPEHNDWWIPVDANLHWSGDLFAVTYNLDFNTTSPPDPCATGLTDPCFLTLPTLEPLTTYYWRVVEVNVPRGGVLYAGDIWIFTTEDPCGKPYDDYLGAGHDKRIITSDSNSDQGTAENLVNGSGISGTDPMLPMLDDVGDFDTEWNGYAYIAATTSPPAPEQVPNPYPLTGEPNVLPWVMFDLGYEYELWLTWLWNGNAYPLEGMRYYTVHYSVGGAGEPDTWSWSQLGDVYELPRAPDVDGEGQPGYVGNAGPAFQGTNVRYVLFTSKENWLGGTDEAVLSEVKFELFPRSEAVGPIPTHGAIDVPIDVNLAWTPGAFVQQAGTAHKIFFGESWDEVNAMTVATWTKALGSELIELPPPSLAVDTEYFWRVDEVNDPCVWRGNIWSFTTEPFVRLDDFEAYRSETCLGNPRHLRCIWEDYYAGIPRLGSFDYISSATANICPGGPHGGTQSMRVKYMTDFAQNDDPDRVFTRRTYSSVQNWSEPLAALSIWFFGDLNDVSVAGGSERITAEDMYVTLEDEQGDKAKVYYVADGGDDVDDLIAREWIEWHIALRDFNEVNGINLDKIDSISIGVKFNGALPLSKQKGQIWLDDIRVYAQRCVPRYAVDFSSAPYGPYLGEPDCFVDEWDVDVMFTDWLVGDANYLSVAPGDANLLVEYLFNTDLSDSSGNLRHGIAINDVNVHAGMLTLINTDEVNDFNAVRIPLDANTFNGPRPFTIVMDVNIESGSVMFGVSPPSPNDPCDTSDSYKSYDQAMTLFHSPSGEFGTDVVVRDNSYQGPSGSITESGVAHGQWYTVATTSDGNNVQATYLITGRQMWFEEIEGFPEEGPQMLLPERHKVMIGYTYHVAFNDPEFEDFMGAEAMNGDADNVRIYNRVLSAGEIVYLSGVPAGEFIYMPVDSDADLYEDEPAATSLESTRLVNFKDYAVLVEHWLEYQPFPPDED